MTGGRQPCGNARRQRRAAGKAHRPPTPDRAARLTNQGRHRTLRTPRAATRSPRPRPISVLGAGRRAAARRTLRIRAGTRAALKRGAPSTSAAGTGAHQRLTRVCFPRRITKAPTVAFAHLLGNRRGRCAGPGKCRDLGERAGVAKLADATALGAVVPKDLWVQIPPPALFSHHPPGLSGGVREISFASCRGTDRIQRLLPLHRCRARGAHRGNGGRGRFVNGRHRHCEAGHWRLCDES